MPSKRRYARKPTYRGSGKYRGAVQQYLTRTANWYGNGRRSLPMPANPISSGLPPTMWARHVYCERYSFTNTSGTTAGYAFRMNDLYDPNLTGTGHQPKLFDQFSALYTNFCVTSCEVEIDWTSDGGAFVGHVASSDLLSSADMSSWVEQYGGTTVPINSYTTAQEKRKYLSHVICGVSKEDYRGELSFQGSSSGSPSRSAYLYLYGGPTDGGTSRTMYFNLKLTYTALWTRPINQAQS